MTRCRNTTAIVLALAVAVLSPTRASALGSEQLGNMPVTGGFGFSSELLDAVNVPERVYFFEVNGNPFFFFKGTQRDLNEAIRKFAAITAEKREIILVPGPGKRHTFDGKKQIEFDWSLHVPLGDFFQADSDVDDNRATLTIYVPEPRPAALADPAQARKWIADLDNVEFKVRDQAAKALEKLGRGAIPLLREGLKSTTSLDIRSRLELMLARMECIELDLLQFPKDIPIIGVETLLDRSRATMKSNKSDARGIGVSSLARHGAATSEILPDLIKILKDEKNEYVLRCAASALTSLGAEAKTILREHSKMHEGAVRQAFEQGLEIVAKEQVTADSEEQIKKRAAVRHDIREFLKVRAEKK